MSEEKAVQSISSPSEELMPIPRNLWDKYQDRLKVYAEKRTEIQAFIKDGLIDGEDYGQTFELSDWEKKQGRKEPPKTLKKSGSLKIQALMECQVKLYPDSGTWKMLGMASGVVAYVGYVLDRELLGMILQYLPKIGFEHEQAVVRLFSWGEGRGAAEVGEKVYSEKAGVGKAGKPLAGAANRTIKMAEKRCDVDAVIRTFGLEFAQDEGYRNDGRLRGETPEDSAVEKVQSLHKVSEEEAGCYTAIMGQLGQRIRGKPLFEPDDAIAIKTRADKALKDGGAAIQALYKEIQVTAVERTRFLTGKNGEGAKNG